VSLLLRGSTVAAPARLSRLAPARENWQVHGPVRAATQKRGLELKTELGAPYMSGWNVHGKLNDDPAGP